MSIFPKINKLQTNIDKIIERLIQGDSVHSIATEFNVHIYTLRRFIEHSDYIHNELSKRNYKLCTRAQSYIKPSIKVPSVCQAISNEITNIRGKLNRLLYNIISSKKISYEDLRGLINSCHNDRIINTTQKYNLGNHIVRNIREFCKLPHIMKYIILNYNQNEILHELIENRENFNYIRKFCKINRSTYQELKRQYYDTKYFSNYIVRA